MRISFEFARRIGLLSVGLILLLLPVLAVAQSHEAADEAVQQPVNALDTLGSFVTLQQQLRRDIKALNQEIASATSESEKLVLTLQLEQLKADLKTTSNNFENIAAGVDIATLRGEPEEEFNLQREVFSLVRPAIDEMKEMTAKVRQKSELKEKIAFYQERLPIIEKALSNIDALIEAGTEKNLLQSLRAIRSQWVKQQAFMQSELQAARLQLQKLVESETSLVEASQSYLKSFFRKRGLYLTMALGVVIGIILLSRLSAAAMYRYLPGFRARHRSFRVRLVELLHRIFTVLLAILGPMLVFYTVEDWVLFSLGILLLLGISWTLRQTIPRYWSQIQLFLNIGSVREGERLTLEGLPWLVEQINVYTTLVNPIANLRQRVPIDELVDMKSRPYQPDEPWFPCSRDDWVILDNAVRGKVVGISHELVQLIERGGARVTYQMKDFLSHSPRNLSTNFRIKETVGISYALQRQSTGEIPQKLQDYLQQQLEQEGYAEHLLNLRVEFAAANSSSLDLQVIADFSGDQGPLYNRLRRAIQRWSVDACSEYGWEIPFPQLTLHGALARTE